MYYKIKKTVLPLLLLITGGIVNIVSAQTVVYKVGENPFIIKKSAALEADSGNRGFLPPRMSRKDRDSISVGSPIPTGLLVWCKDCNISTNPTSGELCVWQGTAWIPFPFVTTPRLTTGKKRDNNKPVKSSNGITISGTLEDIFGVAPTETGIVYREIKGNDFATLPSLNSLGIAVAPDYKVVGTSPVTTAGGAISVIIPTLNTTTGSARPYYFRTYAMSLSGIGYGNPIIFSMAPPQFSIVNVSNTGSMSPVFQCRLIVNAGTYPNTIKEFGYCSSTTNSTPTIETDTKVVISATPKGIEDLGKLNSKLNSESFTADPVLDLSVSDYTTNNTMSTGNNYFRFYVITNDNPAPIYSEVKTFIPPVATFSGYTCTGGTSNGIITVKEKIEDVSQTISVNVDKAGSYSVSTNTVNGVSFESTGVLANTGLQTITLTASGEPSSSGTYKFTLNMSSVCEFSVNIANPLPIDAICNSGTSTEVKTITSESGQVWMDRNLGASRPARSAIDYKAYGCLYQWGRGNDGHASITWRAYDKGVGKNGTTTTASDNPGTDFVLVPSSSPDNDWRSTPKNDLWDANADNNPCPTGYRIPTITELDKEMTQYTITNSDQTKLSPLKFVLPGFRSNIDGSVVNAGIETQLWTSTSINNKASTRYINAAQSVSVPGTRSVGYSVRCIKK